MCEKRRRIWKKETHYVSKETLYETKEIHYASKETLYETKETHYASKEAHDSSKGTFGSYVERKPSKNMCQKRHITLCVKKDRLYFQTNLYK